MQPIIFFYRLAHDRRGLLAVAGLLLLLTMNASLAADTLRVPQDFKTIQAALNAAKPSDTVLVEPGTYHERIRLTPGVTLKSAGDDLKGTLGLKRAETTIIDGRFDGATGAGVAMAEESTLDGFTVTGVGDYDDALWKKHHATQGSEQPHEQIGAPGVAGIAVIGIQRCSITNNIVHHIGYTGIAITGAEGKRVAPLVLRNIAYRNMAGGIGSMNGSTATIEDNVCFENFYAGIGHENASPLVIGNTCYANIRAGIGVSEGACPIVRGNKCHKNRRAGIGVRTGETTQPIIEGNECFENDMAGIGCEEECRPIVRGNRCHGNALAGIGCRDHARPTILDNKCYRNRAAGIGSEGGAQPVILRNECYENETSGIGQRGGAQTTLIGNYVHHNKAAGIGFDECESGRSDVLNNRVAENAQVAVGIHAGWKVRLSGNDLSRGEGMPPVVMVFRGAEADFSDNLLRGSGVAAIRTEGRVMAKNNRFECASLRAGGPPQFAVWGLSGSEVTFLNNTVRGWRHALVAEQATVLIRGNRIENYGQLGIKIEKPVGKAIAVDNEFVSERDGTGILVTGGEGVVENNRFQAPHKETSQKD